MEDWRLTNQFDYLSNKRIKKAKFSDYPEKDHEHCSFCWGKFGNAEEFLQHGYCTDDEHHWICNKCFDDFKELFQWKLVE